MNVQNCCYWCDHEGTRDLGDCLLNSNKLHKNTYESSEAAFAVLFNSGNLTTHKPSPSQIIKNQEKQPSTPNPKNKQTKESFLQNLAYSKNIALLQFYKQIYNNYIIDRPLFKTERSQPAGFFSAFSHAPARRKGAGAAMSPYEEYSYSSALRRPKSIQPK